MRILACSSLQRYPLRYLIFPFETLNNYFREFQPNSEDSCYRKKGPHFVTIHCMNAVEYIFSKVAFCLLAYFCEHVIRYGCNYIELKKSSYSVFLSLFRMFQPKK